MAETSKDVTINASEIGDEADNQHTTHTTMADKDTQSTIADGGTKFGVG